MEISWAHSFAGMNFVLEWFQNSFPRICIHAYIITHASVIIYVRLCLPRRRRHLVLLSQIQYRDSNSYALYWYQESIVTRGDRVRCNLYLVGDIDKLWTSVSSRKPTVFPAFPGRNLSVTDQSSPTHTHTDLSIFLSVYLCIYLPIYLWICINVSIYLSSVDLCINVSIYLPIYVSLYINLSTCLWIYVSLCIYLPIYLWIQVSMYVCMYVSMDFCINAYLSFRFI